MTPTAHDERELPPGVHPIAAALPWYVNGTLQSVECDRVAEHLKHCETCRAELESLLQISARLQSVYRTLPEVSPQVRGTVMAAVRSAGRDDIRAKDRGGALGVRLPDLIRSWFAPKWAPTVALGVVLVQAATLVWVLPLQAPQPEVTSRSVGAAPLRLSVVFNPLATERDIRTALRDLEANVVAGPTRDGAYLIEIAPGDPQALQRKLMALRENRELVQSIGAP
jgi:Putative zinc-finger